MCVAKVPMLKSKSCPPPRSFRGDCASSAAAMPASIRPASTQPMASFCADGMCFSEWLAARRVARCYGVVWPEEIAILLRSDMTTSAAHSHATRLRQLPASYRSGPRRRDAHVPATVGVVSARDHRRPPAPGATHPFDQKPGGGVADLPHPHPGCLRAALCRGLPRGTHWRRYPCSPLDTGYTGQDAAFGTLSSRSCRPLTGDLRAREVSRVSAGSLVEEPRGVPGRSAGTGPSAPGRLVEAAA